VKWLLLDVDDVLYDSSYLKSVARELAVRAMRDVGLPIDEEVALETLGEVVKEKGDDYPYHFNEMMRRLGLKEDFRVIAAGVVAYHDVKRALLKPMPGVVDLILQARDMGVKVGVISKGPPVKEWEKVIRLGLFHLVDRAWIGEDISVDSVVREVGDNLLLVTADQELAKEATSIGVKVIYIASKEPDPSLAKSGAEVVGRWEALGRIRSLLREL